MGAMTSQITSLTIVYSTVYSRRRSKKTSKLRVTGLCEGNSSVTNEFPTQRTSNTENVSIWWRHHEMSRSARFCFNFHDQCRSYEYSPINLIHKYHNAPVPYPAMPQSEQKCAHFCFEWCIMGCGTGVLGIFEIGLFQGQCLARFSSIPQDVVMSRSAPNLFHLLWRCYQ